MTTNTPHNTYFSFPSYESHFFGPMEEEPTPATPTLTEKIRQPHLDIATQAYPIIQRDPHREAEVELGFVLAAIRLASTPQESASPSLYQCSEDSSCASSIISSRPPSIVESIKSWWRFSYSE
ncbi:hypothetical protein H4Q26_011675 [Puccinia striiformis f. sp. tritici PST-130]|uniref:Uncharacterized protein n=1 Tax=Puccinia striiformis f. sp. tritici PST-78 TaxID=1165861 RepID=A0A0L0VWP6_9BASI|nr:hypothetical protein H4Q26_011675 [Puccinia striiformis f. sp. tritici PST-130]KNF03607.1 hypothetical protein PSTG_03130 [Puccinia striiformis f. sp. tritici PST-78]